MHCAYGVPIQISSLSNKSSLVETCDNVTTQDFILFEKLLLNENQITFKGKINTLDVIVKILTITSSKNNEFEILNFLQTKSSKSRLFPKPYLKIVHDGSSFSIGGIEIEDPFEILIYEFIPGSPIGLYDLETHFDLIKSDISVFLDELHLLGVIHADVSYRNIIKDSTGHYHLIDYGCAFSNYLPEFPPLQFMLDDYRNGFPTEQCDINSLDCIDLPF